MWIRLIERYGNAKVVDQSLQDVFMNEGPSRITNSSKKSLGYLMCYKKHKALMSSDQRKAQLANLYRAKGKRFNLRTFFKLLSKHNKKDWFWAYVTRHKMWPYLRRLHRFLTGLKR